MGMGESQLPSHPKSHPKSHHPIPFAIIPSQSQIPSQIPFKSSGRRRTKIPTFEPAHRDESNGGIHILLQPLDAKLIGKMPSFLSLLGLRHLTFHQISRLPVVIEEWEYNHSTRLDELVRMVVFP